MRIKIVLVIAFWLSGWLAYGQNTVVRGSVTDSITGETLPYVSLVLKGTTIGTATDVYGDFYLATSSNETTLLVSYLGYQEKTIKIRSGRVNDFAIKMAPASIALDEIIIKPKKERYTKKENPAVIFVRNAIERRSANDPRNHDYFQYEHYEKMTFGMNEFNPKPKSPDKKPGRFDFLIDFIDTLEMGKTILPVSERERLENVYYRKSPRSEKRVVKASKAAGVDEIFSREGVQQVLNEVFKEVDIFQNDIPLFLQRFVSPLSRMAPDFYKFYLLDTLEVNGAECVDLGFVPFNSESFGFTGHMFITLDSTWFVQKVQLNIPKDINLNFVSGMLVEQTYERLPDGTRIIVKDDIQADLKLTEKTKGMYARRLCVYREHSFNPPEDPLVFNESAQVITLDDAFGKKEDFWEEVRPDEAVKRNSNSVEKLMEQLRGVPLFYVTEKVVSIFVNGYVQTHKQEDKSKFEIGPVNTFISPNNIEGWRFRVGGTTRPAFSKRLFLDGFMAYGTKDEKLKFDATAEYSFHDKDQFRKEFPVHSVRARMAYDVNQIGQQYLYTNKDNMFLSVKRQKDTRATYLRTAELAYTNESYNGWGFYTTLRNMTETATEWTEFNQIGRDGEITPIKSYDMTELEFRIRYAPNEKFYQTRNYRYPITLDAPVFTLSHVTAKKGFIGSDYNYNRTDFGIQKRFWFSAFGYVDLMAKAGKVWDKVPYPMLILPNANLSYMIYPESYLNMNALEFINDEYASLEVSYYLNGTILNRIPLLKKLQWREIVSFRGLWGNLTDKNNPMINGSGLFAFPEGSYVMDKNTPYMEVSVGLENIFKFIRVDYTWRLTYLDNPGIDKHGLRFMFKLSF